MATRHAWWASCPAEWSRGWEEGLGWSQVRASICTFAQALYISGGLVIIKNQSVDVKLMIL